jgi:hypothetical protein
MHFGDRSEKELLSGRTILLVTMAQEARLYPTMISSSVAGLNGMWLGLCG